MNKSEALFLAIIQLDKAAKENFDRYRSLSISFPMAAKEIGEVAIDLQEAANLLRQMRLEIETENNGNAPAPSLTVGGEDGK